MSFYSKNNFHLSESTPVASDLVAAQVLSLMNPSADFAYPDGYNMPSVVKRYQTTYNQIIENNDMLIIANLMAQGNTLAYIYTKNDNNKWTPLGKIKTIESLTNLTKMRTCCSEICVSSNTISTTNANLSGAITAVCMYDVPDLDSLSYDTLAKYTMGPQFCRAGIPLATGVCLRSFPTADNPMVDKSNRTFEADRTDYHDLTKNGNGSQNVELSPFRTLSKQFRIQVNYTGDISAEHPTPCIASVRVGYRINGTTTYNAEYVCTAGDKLIIDNPYSDRNDGGTIVFTVDNRYSISNNSQTIPIYDALNWRLYVTMVDPILGNNDQMRHILIVQGSIGAKNITINGEQRTQFLPVLSTIPQVDLKMGVAYNPQVFELFNLLLATGNYSLIMTKPEYLNFIANTNGIDDVMLIGSASSGHASVTGVISSIIPLWKTAVGALRKAGYVPANLLRGAINGFTNVASRGVGLLADYANSGVNYLESAGLATGQASSAKLKNQIEEVSKTGSASKQDGGKVPEVPDLMDLMLERKSVPIELQKKLDEVRSEVTKNNKLYREAINENKKKDDEIARLTAECEELKSSKQRRLAQKERLIDILETELDKKEQVITSLMREARHNRRDDREQKNTIDLVVGMTSSLSECSQEIDRLKCWLSQLREDYKERCIELQGANRALNVQNQVDPFLYHPPTMSTEVKNRETVEARRRNAQRYNISMNDFNFNRSTGPNFNHEVVDYVRKNGGMLGFREDDFHPNQNRYKGPWIMIESTEVHLITEMMDRHKQFIVTTKNRGHITQIQFFDGNRLWSKEETNEHFHGVPGVALTYRDRGRGTGSASSQGKQGVQGAPDLLQLIRQQQMEQKRKNDQRVFNQQNLQTPILNQETSLSQVRQLYGYQVGHASEQNSDDESPGSIKQGHQKVIAAGDLADMFNKKKTINAGASVKEVEKGNKKPEDDNKPVMTKEDIDELYDQVKDSLPPDLRTYIAKYEFAKQLTELKKNAIDVIKDNMFWYYNNVVTKVTRDWKGLPYWDKIQTHSLFVVIWNGLPHLAMVTCSFVQQPGIQYESVGRFFVDVRWKRDEGEVNKLIAFCEGEPQFIGLISRMQNEGLELYISFDWSTACEMSDFNGNSWTGSMMASLFARDALMIYEGALIGYAWEIPSAKGSAYSFYTSVTYVGQLDKKMSIIQSESVFLKQLASVLGDISMVIACQPDAVPDMIRLNQNQGQLLAGSVSIGARPFTPEYYIVPCDIKMFMNCVRPRVAELMRNKRGGKTVSTEELIRQVSEWVPSVKFKSDGNTVTVDTKDMLETIAKDMTQEHALYHNKIPSLQGPYFRFTNKNHLWDSVDEEIKNSLVQHIIGIVKPYYNITHVKQKPKTGKKTQWSEKKDSITSKVASKINFDNKAKNRLLPQEKQSRQLPGGYKMVARQQPQQGQRLNPVGEDV